MFDLGDVLEYNKTNERCMVVKIYLTLNKIVLFSYDAKDIWIEDYIYLINNYKKIGNIDLSLLIGIFSKGE